MRNLPPRKLIYQRKSAKAAQLIVLTWHESVQMWGSQNYNRGTAAKVSAHLARFVDHFNKTGQQFTLLIERWERRQLPTWQSVVESQNVKSYHRPLA